MSKGCPKKAQIHDFLKSTVYLKYHFQTSSRHASKAPLFTPSIHFSCVWIPQEENYLWNFNIFVKKTGNKLIFIFIWLCSWVKRRSEDCYDFRTSKYKFFLLPRMRWLYEYNKTGNKLISIFIWLCLLVKRMSEDCYYFQTSKGEFFIVYC